MLILSYTLLLLLPSNLQNSLSSGSRRNPFKVGGDQNGRMMVEVSLGEEAGLGGGLGWW